MLPTPRDPNGSSQQVASNDRSYEQRLAIASALHPIPKEMLLLLEECQSCVLASPCQPSSECDLTHSFASVLAAALKPAGQ